jgi:uncharacterized protein (DUF1786 family)
LKILAIDIGLGTQDILLFDTERLPENSPKLVLPSPAMLYRRRVKALLSQGRDILLEGSIIGGAGLISPLTGHIQSGFSVLMTPAAAYSLRNDLAEVKEKGIEVVEEVPFGFTGLRLTLREIDFLSLASLLRPWDIDLHCTQVAAIAVQDHGVCPPGTSNRRYRLQKMKERLQLDPHPASLSFLSPEIPTFNLRMRAAAEESSRQLPEATPLLMDTSLAAIAGCLADPVVAAQADHPLLCVNLGNGHTLAAIVQRGEIVALFEHHTRALDPARLHDGLVRFAEGSLQDEEIFAAGGHGLFYLQDPPGFSQIRLLAVTGPRRDLIRETDLECYFPAPFGDMMMTGPAGLIRVARERLA